MHDIGRTWRKYFWLTSGGLVFLLCLIIFNQSAQLVLLAKNVHPRLGDAVLILLLLVFGLLLLAPLAGIFSLRRAPQLPEARDTREYADYIQLLHRRLQGNSHLRQAGFIFNEAAEEEAEVARALLVLDSKAKSITQENAAAVFLTTAVSQNGVLDGAFVLASITRMTWQVAKLYNQRPGLRELLVLYGNIAATVLMARSIEDLDLLDDQLEPIIASVVGGGLANLIPGATMITSLLVSSVSQGAVNALLTLRVGCLTRRYCASTTQPDLKMLRRSATLEACALLGVIMKENSILVVKSFAKAARQATQRAIIGRGE